MTANIIDGKSIAEDLRQDIKTQISARINKGLRRPGLAVILVGSDTASRIYVKNKRKACDEAGLLSRSFDLADTTPEKELLDLIDQLNRDTSIDGILVQLPLPDHIDTEKVIEHILPDKDVDGFPPL